MITQEAFDTLLACLDPDRDSAGLKYEEVRQRLMSFFTWRGCLTPEELTDRTIDQVAGRLAGGVQLRATDPYVYFHGVALNILKEHWRAPGRDMAALDNLPPSRNPAVDPVEMREREMERVDKEHRLECLNQCMAKLPPESLDLVAGYHRGEKGMDKVYRLQMAEALKIPLNALRIRVYRIRVSLEDCIKDCLKQSSG